MKTLNGFQHRPRESRRQGQRYRGAVQAEG